MNKLTTLFLLQFIVLTSLAQQTVVHGLVKDSVGNPLELANVMAFTLSDSSIASFGITNDQGFYKLILDVNQGYRIKSSYIGFDDWEKNILIKSDTINLSIDMKESALNLDGFDVVYEFPISISGDTISYKTDAFTNGNERKLKDVLEKLPGFEVDKDGQIKVQGKSVSKILVEGKEFFDGDSKMAVENIPAGVIDKIELLTNYNENQVMKGLGNEEIMAINIKLKDGKKSLWFGDVEAGIGVEERYLAHPNLFFYSPKTSVNFIGDMNNIGKQAFSMRDYFRFNGGFQRISRKGGSQINMTSDELGLAMMQNKRAYNINTQFAALNITHSPNKKWNFSAYGIYSGVQTEMNSRSFRNYVSTNNDRTELTESALNQKIGSGLFKLEAKYTPSATTHLAYESFIKFSDIEDLDDRLSTFGDIPNSILEYSTRNPFSIDQSLLYYKNLNTKNIISAEVSWLYKLQRPSYTLESQEKPFDGVLPIVDTDLYRINQERNINSNKIEAAINYYYLLNSRNHINFRAGINTLNQTYNSSIQQFLDDGNSINFNNDTFNNDAVYTFYDTYVGAQYKIRLAKLTLSPGLNFHYYNNSDVQHSVSKDNSKTLFLPDFYANYEFGSTEDLSLNYSINAEFTDVQNLGESISIRNYNSLFRGNRYLQNQWYHSIDLSYMNFNMYNFTSTYFSLNYQKRYDDINESVAYQGNDRLSQATNAILVNEFAQANGSFQKRYTLFKYKIEAALSYSDYQNNVEFETNRNKTFKQKYKLAIESNFSVWPNIEIGSELVLSDYISSTLNEKYTTISPFINIEAVLPYDFILTAEYIYNDYRSKNNVSNSQYDFLNAVLYYQKKDSAWEFKLSANNILNTKSIRRDSFTDNIISTYEYYVQPAYLLVSATYEL